jgi:hypothetical protein
LLYDIISGVTTLVEDLYGVPALIYSV